MAPESPRTVTTARPPATHHFLLVTPVETGNPPGSPEPAAPVQPTRFASRSSTRAQSLAYRLVAQPPAPDAVPPPGPSGFDMVANRTWLAEVDGTTVLTVECEVRSAAPEPIGGVELELLEADLTELATRVAVDVLGCTRESVAWVGRYALSEPPAGWLGAETVRRPLNGSSETAVIGGWGNGAVTGWSLLDDGARGEVVRGLVDAQYLWHQVDMLSRRSLDIVRGFRTPTPGSERGSCAACSARSRQSGLPSPSTTPLPTTSSSTSRGSGAPLPWPSSKRGSTRTSWRVSGAASPTPTTS